MRSTQRRGVRMHGVVPFVSIAHRVFVCNMEAEIGACKEEAMEGETLPLVVCVCVDELHLPQECLCVSFTREEERERDL